MGGSSSDVPLVLNIGVSILGTSVLIEIVASASFAIVF